MAFTFDNNTSLHLEIDGNEYSAKIDRPEFIDFWRNNVKTLDALKDPSNANTAREIVRFTVDMCTALLGVDASRELFDGKEIGLTDCAAFIGYVMGEIENQGLREKLNSAAAKYGAGSIYR